MAGFDRLSRKSERHQSILRSHRFLSFGCIALGTVASLAILLRLLFPASDLSSVAQLIAP
jgi:hypothetical protein